ncbi:MAG: tail fiber domain-containing protein, partial [Chitinophagaceae bacterium]
NNLTSSVNNVFVGYQSGFATTTGSHNIFLGVQGGYINTTGQYNIALGNYAGPASGALTYATAIGGRARVNISNAIVLGAINGVNGATADTRVGVRTASPGYTFHVNASDAAKVGGGTWVVASDKRLKDNVSDFTDGIDVLSLVHPVKFRYNGKAGIKNDKEFVGIIAQEMQQIAPYTVGHFEYTDETGKKESYLDFDANALTYLLINAVKQQQQKIDSLESEILEIKRMIRSGNTTGDALQPKLFQNQPNPANNSTVIRYFIPDEAKTAYLGIFSMKGELVKTVNIAGRGNGNYVMSIKEFASGAYTYQLVVDRVTVGAKKLIVGK